MNKILGIKHLRTTYYPQFNGMIERWPLEAAYGGPYEVLKRFPKYFVISRLDKKEKISIDCLKAPYPIWKLSRKKDKQ